MADYDPSSIPILDDIITRGDTDKAASRPQNDLLKTLEAEQKEAANITTESAKTAPELEIEKELGIEPGSQDTYTGEQSLNASESAPITDESPFDTITDQPSGEIVEQPPIAIETLTEEILASVMPEMEQLLRERIRQALEQQLQNDDSQATNTSSSS